MIPVECRTFGTANVLGGGIRSRNGECFTRREVLGIRDHYGQLQYPAWFPSMTPRLTHAEKTSVRHVEPPFLFCFGGGGGGGIRNTDTLFAGHG